MLAHSACHAAFEAIITVRGARAGNWSRRCGAGGHFGSHLCSHARPSLADEAEAEHAAVAGGAGEAAAEGAADDQAVVGVNLDPRLDAGLQEEGVLLTLPLGGGARAVADLVNQVR